MNKELNLRNSLWNKLKKEFIQYKDEVIKGDKGFIVDRAYEITIKDRLVDMFDPVVNNLDIESIKALNHLDTPLEELYNCWIKSDGDIDELLSDSLWYDITNITNKYHEEKQKNNSIYER